MPEEETPEVETEEVETEEEVEATPEKEAEEEVESQEDETVPVRNNASYIIQRKDAKIRKLQEELEQREEVPTSLEERLQRLENAQSMDGELSSLFESHPEAREYESQIRKYMGHEAYQKIPAEFIYNGLRANDVQTKTDSKRKAADLEAEQTRNVGSGVRETRSKDEKTASEIKSMTDAEFREYEQELRKRARS